MVDKDGNVIGDYNENPILNTDIYDVEFQDGVIKPYSANVIVWNILNQVDSDGYHSQMLESISDYSKDGSAVTKEYQWLTSKRGNRVRRKTTIGWKLLFKWKDGSKSWVPLKLVKEYNPIKVAEFVKARSVSDEPAFVWWSPTH